MRETALQRLTFKGMTETVAEKLREAILDGTLKPGDALRHSTLAKTLDVSRGPVREALLQLETESLVRNIFHRGWFVIQLTPEEISEILSLRMILEEVALKRAAENANDKDTEFITTVQAELRQAILQRAWVNALGKDFEFHCKFWQLARHRLLEETLIRISNPYFAYLKAVVGTVAFPPEDFEETVRTHGILIDYLAKRTQQTAKECIQAHLSPAIERLALRDGELWLGACRR
jgi:DNA-binding GntR family transcriptional regulator